MESWAETVISPLLSHFVLLHPSSVKVIPLPPGRAISFIFTFPSALRIQPHML